MTTLAPAPAAPLVAARAAGVLVALLVLTDGAFHLFASDNTFDRLAPDREIGCALARAGYWPAAARGLGVVAHRLIGAFLMATSIAAIALLVAFARRNDDTAAARVYYALYFALIAPLTLLVVAVGSAMRARRVAATGAWRVPCAQL